MSYQLNQEKGKKIEIEMPPTVEQTEQPIQETKQQEVQQEQQQEENLQQETQVVEEKKVESNKEQNLRILRERAEKLERERDEALKYIQNLQKPQQQAQPEQEESEELNINENDLVEGKHLAKFAKKYKKLEQQLKQYQQQTSATVTETKLKAQFPDFDKVVSPENIELLKAGYPEIAQTLNSSSDLYNKAVSAYTMIKKLGIVSELQTEKEIIQKNMSKPKPLASISPQQGDTALSRANAFANGLTDDLKAQLRKEMEDARKNI